MMEKNVSYVFMPHKKTNGNQDCLISRKFVSRGSFRFNSKKMLLICMFFFWETHPRAAMSRQYNLRRKINEILLIFATSEDYYHNLFFVDTIFSISRDQVECKLENSDGGREVNAEIINERWE